MNKICPHCRQIVPDKHWCKQSEGRPNAYQRGYGGKIWDADREACFEAKGYLCLHCLEKNPPLYRVATEVDHIIPKARGGIDDVSNYQPLCKPCHSRKTWNERHR